MRKRKWNINFIFIIAIKEYNENNLINIYIYLPRVEEKKQLLYFPLGYTWEEEH